jgi:predicted secreted protein
MTTSLSENNNQEQIQIEVNDIIQIELSESPTTGYRWEIIELDTSNLQVISEDFKLNSDSAIGGGGKKIIQLKVLKKASGRVKLENRKPWSGEVYKTFEVSYS